MKYLLDVHCHTVNSGHGYSTITENAAYAAEIGLEYIGVADHGPKMVDGAHLNYFINLWILPEMICGVRVFKGAEVNILSTRGEIDLPESTLKKLDFVIASLHTSIIPPTNKNDHTNAIIEAMENPYVHILGHPGDPWFEIDVEKVVAHAAKTKTIIEINNMSLDPGSRRYQGEEVFVEILELCKELKVPVLASSDAHFSSRVGDISKAASLIEKVGLPEELVLNTNAERFLAAIQRKSQRS